MYNTTQYMYNTMQYNNIQYSTIQYNTLQYNTIQYNTIQYNTIQYNTIQCDTILYSHFTVGSVSSRIVRGWARVLPPKDGWAREVGLLSLTSAAKCIFSHRGVWRRFMQSCIKSGRFYAMEKHCLKAWSCQGCFLDIVETCVQILNKYERLFTEERQEPSGHADAFTLTCMFVYCGSEEYYGFVSCCCTKSRTSPKLKTFFHWYVFYLLTFRQVMARET